MAITAILAMTKEEIHSVSSTPQRYAFLGCHFSSTGQGLAGLPSSLPSGCGLIIDDRNPPKTFNIQVVLQQLRELDPAYLLLDFQRPSTENTLVLTKELTVLPCPVVLPPDYGKDLHCPVFLPPIPPHISVYEYLRPWKDREVWLELALDATEITVTAGGSQIRSFPHAESAENAHRDSMLHCHYKISRDGDALRFYCYRNKEDVEDLLSALPPNISHAVGLFQELGECFVGR